MCNYDESRTVLINAVAARKLYKADFSVYVRLTITNVFLHFNLERFCNTHHEAILRLIEMSAENAHANGAWIGICGELAADISLTEAFLRMGIDELSVAPPFVLKIRDAVRKIDLRK